jgi:hypothetical protein
VRLIGIIIRNACLLSCKCCVLSGKSVCVGMVTRPEEFYREWCVLTECGHDTSAMRRPLPTRVVAPW